MPKTAEAKEAELRYPTAALLNSKALSGYQRDFAKVLLTKPDYTLREAQDILERFFKGGKT